MSRTRVAECRAALRVVATRARALATTRFFKTGQGEYGEGDVFIGVSVPDTRRVARAFRDLGVSELVTLLRSKVHEERLLAIFLLVHRFEKHPDERREIVRVYLDNTDRVNNWDLVDSSAWQILGRWLLDRDRRSLRSLARSKSLWERRIAMVATYAFIQEGEHDDAFRIATLLERDDHDLIHKACGWMLREVGKRVGTDVLRSYLDEHAPRMRRTALRYSIEHFAPRERKAWLAIRS